MKQLSQDWIQESRLAQICLAKRKFLQLVLPAVVYFALSILSDQKMVILVNTIMVVLPFSEVDPIMQMLNIA